MYKLINGTNSLFVEGDMNDALANGFYLVSFHTTVTTLHEVDYCAVMEKK